MKSIEKARAAKAAKALEKLINYNGTVMTRREFVEALVKEGYWVKTRQEWKIKDMSRLRFFRASAMEQSEHERKQIEAGKKDVYTLEKDGLSYTVTLAEYNYACDLLNALDTELADNCDELFELR